MKKADKEQLRDGAEARPHRRRRRAARLDVPVEGDIIIRHVGLRACAQINQ